MIYKLMGLNFFFKLLLLKKVQNTCTYTKAIKFHEGDYIDEQIL